MIRVVEAGIHLLTDFCIVARRILGRNDAACCDVLLELKSTRTYHSDWDNDGCLVHGAKWGASRPHKHTKPHAVGGEAARESGVVSDPTLLNLDCFLIRICSSFVTKHHPFVHNRSQRRLFNRPTELHRFISLKSTTSGDQSSERNNSDQSKHKTTAGASPRQLSIFSCRLSNRVAQSILYTSSHNGDINNTKAVA